MTTGLGLVGLGLDLGLEGCGLVLEGHDGLGLGGLWPC